MPRRLRFFISSPGDVAEERLRADLILDKLSQDYSRFFVLEAYRWEHEVMLASQHFQDAIEPPSKFDVVILILWSRLGTNLPERTAMREYRGIDNRAPVTGTEWEYEEALQAARERGAPDLLAFRKISAAPIDPSDPDAQAHSFAQLNALNVFWQRHFADRGVFLAAYDQFRTLDEFAHRLEGVLRQLIERRIRESPNDGVVDAGLWLKDPFRGLLSYEFEHATIFFGRNALITKATEQLAASALRSGVAFLLICGDSGTGKSSMVKAGVVPRLSKPQRISGIAFLRRVVFRPGSGGSDLFLGLARTLTNASEDFGLPELLGPGQDPKQLATHLRGAAAEPGYSFAHALGRVTEAARRQGQLLSYEEAKLILVVDQLEEIFTNAEIDAEERRQFIVLLNGLARSGMVWVIATLRADFLPQAIGHPELTSLTEGLRRLDLSTPSPAELAEMIRKPAQAAGLSFEVHPETGLGLDVVLAEDAANAPGVLPLLSFTLDELYTEMRRLGTTVMTHDSYETLGGLQGAIATRAEAVLESMPDAARLALPQVLRALTTVPEAAEQRTVARSARRDRFAEGSPGRQLIEAFTEARLLVASEEASISTVRLAHEALLTAWDRARSQLALDRRDLATRSRAERELERWERAEGRARRLLLLHDPDLANATALADRWGDELDPPLRSFIRRSARRARLQQALTAASAVVFAIVAGAAVFAAHMARQATIEAEVSLWLANSQSQLRAGQIESALDWAWRAFNKKENEDTRSAVLNSLLTISPHLIGRLSVGDAFVQALTWVDDETLGYINSRGDLAFVNEPPSGTRSVRGLPRRVVQTDPNDAKQSVVGLRPVGADRLLAVLRGGGFVVIHATEMGRREVSPPSAAVLNAGPHAVSVSSDGNLIATAPIEEPPRLYRCRSIASTSAPACAVGHVLGAEPARAVEISPAADRIARGEHNRVVIVPVGDPTTSTATLKTGAPVVSLTWHPRRDWLAAGAEDGTVTVFDTAVNAELFSFKNSGSLISTLRWSPTGKALAFVCDLKFVCVASFEAEGTSQGPVMIERFPGHTNTITQLAWAPGGERLATADSGHEIRSWNLIPDRRIAFDLRSGGGSVVELAASPSRRRLAGARLDGDISVWDWSTLSGDAVGRVDPTLQLHSSLRDAVFVTWRNDGALAVAYKDLTVACWAPELADPPTIIPVSHEPFQVAFVDGDALAMVSGEHELYLYDLRAGAANIRLPADTAASPSARALTPHPNGKLLAVSYDGGLILIWDLAARKVAYSLPVVDRSAAPLALTFNPDGRRLAATGGNGYVKVYHPGNSTVWQLAIQAEETGGSAAFSTDGKMLAAIGADDRVYLWTVGDDSAAPFLHVDSAPSGQYASALAWVGPTQLAVLRPEGIIRVYNLDPSAWRDRSNALGLWPK